MTISCAVDEKGQPYRSSLLREVQKEAKEEELIMVKSGKARLHTREVAKSKFQRQKSKTSLSKSGKEKETQTPGGGKRGEAEAYVQIRTV